MRKSILIEKADLLAHLCYKLTKTFPREEIFGLVSQIRRAALSVVINIIEGYARFSPKDYKRFLLISYASLKELKYELSFSFKEGLLDDNKYRKTIELADEVGKMLWSAIQTIKNKTEKRRA